MTKRKPKKRKRLVFKTPGRECAHADQGCCPKCIDPCNLRKQSSTK